MLNFVRFYEFTFFDVDKNNVISPINGIRVANSLNIKIDYNVMNGNFNTAKFILYNISKSTLELFTSTNNRRGFYFRACYDSEKNLKNHLIFQGLTYRVNSYREGPDLLTEITAVDPFFNLQFARIKTINFGNGTTAVEIIKRVADYLGIFNSVYGKEFLVVKPVYSHPISFSNVSITRILDMVCSDNSCSWSYDKNGIRIVPLRNNPNYNTILVSSGGEDESEINKLTGLVGNVRAETLSAQMLPVDYYTQQRLKNNLPYVTATVLMRPFSISDVVNLTVESKELNGLYRVIYVNYAGEYRGSSWYTTLKLSPLG